MQELTISSAWSQFRKQNLLSVARSSRSEFWLNNFSLIFFEFLVLNPLIQFIVTFVIMIASSIIISHTTTDIGYNTVGPIGITGLLLEEPIIGDIGFFGLIYIFGIFLLLPFRLSLLIRRLHDVGKSGFFIILALIPILNIIILYWCIAPSDADNKYGKRPFEASETTLLSALVEWIRKFFIFKGTTSRGTFTFLYIVQIVIYLVLCLFFFFQSSIQQGIIMDEPMIRTLISFSIIAAFNLPLILLFSAAARRLHDMGLSGWLSLGLFIPLINTILVLALLLIRQKVVRTKA